MLEGEEQQVPPAANILFKKKTRINWGKGKHRDLLEKAIQDWHKIMAGNIKKTMSRGVVNVTSLQRIMDPPSNILCTSNLLIHTFWVKDLAAKQMVDK